MGPRLRVGGRGRAMGRGRANAIACDLLDEAGEVELLGVITR